MHLRLILAALAVLFAWPVAAGPFPTVGGSFAICDPNNPTNCLAPNSSGGLPGTGGGGGVALPQGITTTATNPTVPASTATQLLGANGPRKYLQVANETGGDCHFAFGSTQPGPAVGMLLANRAISTTESSSIDTRALNVSCAQGGVIDILEGQ